MQRVLFALALGLAVITLGAQYAGQRPPVPVPEGNPQTADKVALGAQLYFDTRLSADNTISCATCHDPSAGWANHNATDTGIKGQVGNRNSGTILDAAYMKFQFWDGRAASLEEQALGPIHNPIEMGETLENVDSEVERHFGLSQSVPRASSGRTPRRMASPKPSPPSNVRSSRDPPPTIATWRATRRPCRRQPCADWPCSPAKGAA